MVCCICMSQVRVALSLQVGKLPIAAFKDNCREASTICQNEGLLLVRQFEVN